MSAISIASSLQQRTLRVFVASRHHTPGRLQSRLTAMSVSWKTPSDNVAWSECLASADDTLRACASPKVAELEVSATGRPLPKPPCERRFHAVADVGSMTTGVVEVGASGGAGDPAGPLLAAGRSCEAGGLEAEQGHVAPATAVSACGSSGWLKWM